MTITLTPETLDVEQAISLETAIRLEVQGRFLTPFKTFVHQRTVDALEEVLALELSGKVRRSAQFKKDVLQRLTHPTLLEAAS